MQDELLVVKEIETPSFECQDDRNDFIKEYSGNCWWIAEYLDATIPHVL